MGSRLSGKTALITGSTSNIGRAIAEAFAAEGAHVIVSGRDDERGASVVANIRRAGGTADYVRADLDGGLPASQALAKAAAESLGGRIDILVNNAGIFPATTTLSADEETVDRILAVNVKAAFFLTQAVAPGMIEQGSGVIVNLGSWVARLGVPVGSLYAATKGAMETLTRAWSSEFGNRGIRVNAISPGVIADPVHYGDGEHPADVMMRGTPSDRAGNPDAIASAAVFLASEEASFVHGTVIDVDGGRTGTAVIADPYAFRDHESAA
jgi:NAD(P)-dependent dehydrogenase (short-subunit alcohol dehydrogenase family)